jgi:8-oxo-dGTP pyrophosphatase MutT (NUDIX family)
MNRAKKKSEEIVHENPWWTYMHDTMDLPDGNTGHYYYAKTRGGAAFVVPVLSDGRIVLISQYRYLTDTISVEFPGGGVEVGEDPRSAAIRELAEEAGCAVRDIKEIGVFEPANGYVKDKTHVYLAHVDIVQDPTPEVTGGVERMVRTRREVEYMVRGNDIWDGQTLAAWALVQTYISEEAAKEVNTEDPILSRVIQTLFS